VNPGDDGPRSVEGRTRRLGSVSATIVAFVAVIGALALASRWFGGGDAADRPVVATTTADTGRRVAETELDGRLVYATFDVIGSPPLQQRLVVLGLADGTISEGPRIPRAEELFAAGRADDVLVVIADDAGRGGIAYAVEDLSADAEAREVARGDVITRAPSGELLVGDSMFGRGGCDGPSYVLTMVDPATGDRHRGPGAGCGQLLSAVAFRGGALVSVERGGTVTTGSPGSAPLLEGAAVLSRSPRGAYVLADTENGPVRRLGVWPGTPTGPLLVWPGAGAPRPLVQDVAMFGERVVAWSPSGSRVVVGGIRRDERGLWLVGVGTGTATLLGTPNVSPIRSAFAGATFDARGNAFVGSPGHIDVVTAEGRFPVPLPAGAPAPIGPIVWLP
jgi:hypothetical protein